MRLQESAEMYLETIYVLSIKTGNVRSIDVAEHMGYSKPSVSRALGILKKSGHVQVDKNGHILLTEEGMCRTTSLSISLMGLFLLYPLG